MSNIPRFRLRAASWMALGCLFGASLLTTATPVRAQSDDPSFETRILRNVLTGLGLKRGDEPGIDYQERAPLVIPPSRDLPPPESLGAATAGNPAWPNDPDIARAKREAEAARHRNIQAEIETEQNPLRPDQMTPGAKNGATARSARRVDNASISSDGSDRLRPDEVGQNGSIFSNMFGSKTDEQVKFTKERARTSLTDPPPGYQTPSPNQPYGAGSGTIVRKPNDYMETHGTLEGGAR